MNIGLRIFLGYFLIVALAALLLARVFVAEVKPGVRQAMEDTLVDTANVLAELAAEDLIAGRIGQGSFAEGVRALRGRDFGADIWGFGKRGASYRLYVTDADGVVVFDSDAAQGRAGAVGQDYSRWNDVYLTLRGRYGARSSRSDPDDPESTVMHVAAPIRDDAGDIIGVLTVAKPNRALEPFIQRSQSVVMRWGWVLMGSALIIGLAAAWWLARQLGGLRRYADAVTAGERAVPPSSAGEFGHLGQALETMRAKLDGKQYVEQYVHELTHEMKGPLAAIRGSAELLEDAPGRAPMDAADRARFVASIRVQSERLAQMIDKLLALAAVEHRQRLEAPEAVSLAALVEQVAEQCRPALDRRGLSLRLELAPDLAPVTGDAFLLRQALINLIDNAADFSAANTSTQGQFLPLEKGGRGDLLLPQNSNSKSKSSPTLLFERRESIMGGKNAEDFSTASTSTPGQLPPSKKGGRGDLLLPQDTQSHSKSSPTLLFERRESIKGGEIVVRLGEHTGVLKLEVIDSGPGVPDYALPRVFERFYSLPRPDGGSRSSGLGLCFVAEVAALHGGRAELANREGGGAVATLILPAG